MYKSSHHRTSAIMGRNKLWFLLLLPLSLCLDTKENVVKTVGKDPDFSPLCSIAALSTITRIVCKIEAKWMSGGEGCGLLYPSETGHEQNCDSRFSLKTENQTVFLQMTNIRPEDSGNYTCQCSHGTGTHTLHLQVTVEDAASFSFLTVVSLMAVISTAVGFLIVTGVLLGFTLRKIHCGRYSHSRKFEISEKQDGLYASLEQPSDDLYQMTSSGRRHHINTQMINLARKALRVREQTETREQMDEIYENTKS